MNSVSATTRHPLERLLMPLEPLSLSELGEDSDREASERGQVRCIRSPGAPEWLRADGWSVRVAVSSERSDTNGKRIARFARSSGDVTEARQATDGSVTVPFSLAEAYLGLTLEHWTIDSRQRALPPSALNLFYRIKHVIPRGAQLAARRALVRIQGVPRFPAWPYEDSVAGLLRFAIRCSLLARKRDELLFHWFWPRGASAAAILTHDIESKDGLRNAVRVANLEQERELRSSFNVVGQGYKLDWGIISELRGRGFELGVHGVYHDRSLFSSRGEFERQQPLLRETARRLDACGFRSPATHRVNAWLAELPFEYDCTIPLSDPYEPQPGGSCSPWPFFLGKVVELPYTLPQDHTVFTLLRHHTAAVWTAQVERLERSHGLIQCVSHPDPGYLGDPSNEARYAEFLDFLVERKSLWFALPREVARWWVQRDTTQSLRSRDNCGIARLYDHGEIELHRPPVGVPAR